MLPNAQRRSLISIFVSSAAGFFMKSRRSCVLHPSTSQQQRIQRRRTPSTTRNKARRKKAKAKGEQGKKDSLFFIFPTHGLDSQYARCLPISTPKIIPMCWNHACPYVVLRSPYSGEFFLSRASTGVKRHNMLCSCYHQNSTLS